jgi:hypothetical protein
MSPHFTRPHLPARGVGLLLPDASLSANSPHLPDNQDVDIRRLDDRLSEWIAVANERSERYGFPPGLVEQRVQILKARLGAGFLAELYAGKQPLHLLGLRGQVLQLWLRGGAYVDRHVIQIVDLASMFEEFDDDPGLVDKIHRLKTSSFWPTQFELAMAFRAKRTIGNHGTVRLSRETNAAIGDFMIDLGGSSIACECARLEFGEHEEEQYKLVGDLYQYLDRKLKSTSRPCCVKIRLRESLNPTSFLDMVQCVKRGLAIFSSRGEEATVRVRGAEVTIERLGESTERIPFRYTNGCVHAVRATEWVTAHSLSRVAAESDEQAAAMYRAGIDFQQQEQARVFVSWGRTEANIDPYARIQSKIRKKKNQTKTGESLAGKVIFLESQWSVLDLDKDRLRHIIDREMDISRNTITVVIAERCMNVHYRPWYRYCTTKIGPSFVSDRTLCDFFMRFYTYDRDNDPILDQPYQRTWEQASNLVRQHEIEWERENARRESNL